MWLEATAEGERAPSGPSHCRCLKITATVTLSEPLCTDFFFQCGSREGASSTSFDNDPMWQELKD